MCNLVFINSHPVQYNAPLYQKIATDGRFNLRVFYCSDESVRGGKDKEFNVDVKWNIPLLEGYTFRFLRNYSWKPSINNGFFGLINISVIAELYKLPKSIIVVHGWAYVTSILAIIVGKILGHRIYLRGESPYNQEILKGKKNQLYKKILLKRLLFKFVDKFLYIGNQNKRFYQSLGVRDRDLIFTPYAVDNERFRDSYKKLKPLKGAIKQQLNIPQQHKVILFTGKYIKKKRPLDLLAAFAGLNRHDISLVMVGEGELRTELEKLVEVKHIENVYLTGFINQSEICNYYAIADIFVMCSDAGETWGLSVNEAMNFSLPLLLSGITGCSVDLVINGLNGFVFEKGNVQQLTEQLEYMLNFENLEEMGIKSFNIVKKYSYDTILENLSQACHAFVKI